MGRGGAALRGIGHAVPSQVVDNATIAARLGVEPEWIARRTGTERRHHLGEGERLETLATRAASSALADAGVDGTAVDLVVVGTTSADELSPHCSVLVAGAIGARGAATMDISAACTGFLAGLSMAAGAIESGRARTAVVIGADGLSRYLDRDDRDTAALFGDGAGAAVVTRAEDGAGGIGPVALHSDPTARDLIRLGREPGATISMDGRAVFRRAVALMAEVTREAIEASGADAIDRYVFHQANSRIIHAVGTELDLPPDRVVDVVSDFANTSAASIPIGLSVTRDAGHLHPGAHVLLAAFGAGLVYGATVIRWDAPAG